MSASRSVAVFCLLAIAAVQARAQSTNRDAEALKASVMQVLSLATFGMVTVEDPQGTVTREGPDYRMRLKLSGLSAPADAALTAVARPLGNGRVGIESMTFPSSGAIETKLAPGMTNRIEYSVGRQTITGTIDPTLASESTYAADFSRVRLMTTQEDLHSEQTIDQLATEGSVSPGAGGWLTFASGSQGTGFHITGHGRNGLVSDTSARAFAGHVSIEGLDRAQGARLLTALRGLIAAGAQAQTPQGQVPELQVPAGVLPEQRRQLGPLVEAAAGLLSRIEVDDTMEDVRISVGTASGGGAGTIGSVRLAMAGDAAQDRLNASLGLAVEGITVPAMATEAGALIPHHVDLRTMLTGVPATRLITLLREAAAEHANLVALQTQARALLADPSARVAIESLSFDAGPLSVTGSATLLPRVDGQFGGEIHIAARGVDALLGQMQGQPKLQQAMPMIFMAKGLARVQGDNLVWDITLGDGPLTINGTPFGQPAGRTR